MLSFAHRSERQDEICQDIRDTRLYLDRTNERLDRLERMLVALYDAREPRASRVAQAVEDPSKLAGTILVALSDEMGGSPAEKTLRDAVTRYVADPPARAHYVKAGVLGENEKASTSWTLARYLAEEQPGSNRWGAPTTRRIHKLLDQLKLQPSVKRAAP